MKRRSLAVATCLALIGWYGLARAEEPAAAQAAFDDGKRLVEEGRLERACAKFAESQRLDPAGGTLLHLADCYDRAEKTASAFHTYGAALAQARKDGRGDREQAAKDRLERLGPRMSLIRIDVPSTSRVP
nr:hypothetical protein [Polyangiaceae bacterium]